MNDEEDVTDALVPEESQVGTKFRRRTQPLPQVPPQPPRKPTFRELLCRESEAPCSCLNFQAFSRHPDRLIRGAGWVFRVLFPAVDVVAVGLLSSQAALSWSVECQEPMHLHFVLSSLLSLVAVFVWILFFVENIPKLLRLRLLLAPILCILWASYGFAISRNEDYGSCGHSELPSVVLYQSLVLFFAAVFPLIVAIVGFYLAIVFMLLGALVSGLWAGVMTVATAACCCPCARRSYAERLGEPLHCAWFGACGKDCAPEFGMQTDMPCSSLNFEALASRTDLWSRLGTWTLRCSFLTGGICLVGFVGYRVHEDWLLPCEYPLRVQFCVAAPLFFCVLLAWDMFFVESIPKVLRMWCMAGAVLGLAWASYGISIAQFELDHTIRAICASSQLPVLVLSFNVALLLASLLPLLAVIVGFYSVIVVGLIAFLTSLLWAGLMSMFTTACCCPCARRTLAERMQEPAACEWFGKCGRDCAPVYGQRGDDVPCSCLKFTSLAARQEPFLFMDPRISAWVLRVLLIGGSVSCIVYLSRWMGPECEWPELLVFELSAAFYVLVLLGWQLFAVEKVPRVVRLWVIVVSTLGLIWGSYGLHSNSDPQSSCAVGALAQSVALVLAALLPLILLIVGFYVLIVIGLFGFLVSVCYASACVCLSHCCPITLASKRSFVRRANEPLKCQWFSRCCGLCPPDEATKAEMTLAANLAAAKQQELQAKRDKSAGLVAFLIPSLRNRTHLESPLRNFYTSPQWDRNLNSLIRDFLD